MSSRIECRATADQEATEHEDGQDSPASHSVCLVLSVKPVSLSGDSEQLLNEAGDGCEEEQDLNARL